MNKAIIVAVLLAAGAVKPAAQTSAPANFEEKERSDCKFSVMVKPWGWELPKHGDARSRKPFAALDHHPSLPGVYETDLGDGGKMNLPWYYTEKRRLMLYSFYFRVHHVIRFDVNGKPFRYVAEAIGMHIGAGAIACWTDRDGDGTFEEFDWTGDVFGNLPDWVNKIVDENVAR